MAMARFPSSPLPVLLLPLIFLLLLLPLSSLSSCSNSCGSLPVRYPFGTGYGCGSPLFHPSVTCTGDDSGEQRRLVLTTHTGAYPITSISYSTSTLTISPPAMSNCSTMFPSTPNFGLDWSGPFQLGPSLFVLLGCPAPTKFQSSAVCDAAEAHLCVSLHSCPGVLSLGIPIFAPADTCCVYSPASLGPKGELDLQGLRCAAYTSVVSYGDVATDPLRWQYGVALKFGRSTGWFRQYGDDQAEVCAACERSGGVCGYAPPENYFVCVCRSGVNTSVDCAGQENAAARDFYLKSSAKSLLPSHGNLIISGCSFFGLPLFVMAIRAM